MVTVARQFTPEEQEQNSRHYLKLLKDGFAPDKMPDCGKWTPLIVLMEEACAKANGNRAFLYDSMLDSLKQKHASFKAMLEGKSGQGQSKQGVQVEDGVFVPPLPESARIEPGLAIGACEWLKRYIEHSKRVSPEGYEDFHENTGLWVLSTIAARRVKIPFSRRQYTPLMIMLVARGGLFIKSDTVEVGIDVLQAANLRWMLGADETTPQKLMTDMVGDIPKNYDSMSSDKIFALHRRLAFAGQRGWYYDEIGELIRAIVKENGAMQDFKGLLLKLDKCADQYEYSTQTRGSELIEKPYLPLLGLTTPMEIRESAKSGSKFWSNGFLDRFAFSCPPPNAYIDSPFKLGEIHVPYDIWEPLKEWHERLGIPEFGVEVNKDEKGKITGYTIVRGELPETSYGLELETYSAWVRYRSALKTISAQAGIEDLDGSYNRLSIKAIRVAALFASLEGSKTIQIKHWALAQEIAERWRKSLHELYSQVNRQSESSPNKKLEEDILRTVEKLSKQGKPPTIRDMTRYIPKIDVGRLKLVTNDLVRNGLLTEDKMGRSPRYSLQHEEE